MLVDLGVRVNEDLALAVIRAGVAPQEAGVETLPFAGRDGQLDGIEIKHVGASDRYDHAGGVVDSVEADPRGVCSWRQVSQDAVILNCY